MNTPASDIIKPHAMRDSTAQSLWMLVASLLFAMMGVCVKLGAERYSPAELVFYRGFVSLVMFGGFVAFKGWRIGTPLWRAHVNRGISGSLALLLYFYAITQLPLPTAVTLNYTSPLWLALFVTLLNRQRIQPWLLGAILLGFAGIVLLLRPTIGQGQGLGALLGLSSGALAGVAFINVRKLGELGEPEWRIVFWFSAIATLIGLPWVASGDLHAIDLKGGLLLLGVGLFGGAAQFALTRAYRHGKLLLSASFSYFTVVFSSVFGWLIWSDALPWSSVSGIVLITASGVIASIRSRASPAEPD